MNDINNVTLTGRLTRDPEVFSTNNGLEIYTTDLAVSKSWKKDDEWQEKTAFIKIKRFQYAINAAKGDHVSIIGKLDIDKWEDKEGNKRVTASIIIDQIVKAPKSKAAGFTKGDDEPEF
jgi:single-strand DNA-binding protein